MTRAILLLTCPDRPGIAADTAGWAAANGGNILDAEQYSDPHHGLFLQRVEISTDLTAAELRQSFRAVAERWSMTWELFEAPRTARLAILVSKTAHCLYDLLGRCSTGDLDAVATVVISNHADLAPDVARFDVPFRHLAVAEGSPEGRRAQEVAVTEHLREVDPDLIVLARYMRVLSPEFCREFGGRTINIHHSFLPAFVGANAYRQAWERGVKLIGATAHYVTTDLDEGPIIAQDVARVNHADTPSTMTRRGRDLEAVVLATAVRAHLDHRVVAYANRTVVFD